MTDIGTTVAVVLLVVSFLLVVIISWVLTLLGLPGNWFIIGLAVGYDLLLPDGARLELGWPLIIALVVLAAVGEVLEFFASAATVKRRGGSTRSAVLSLIGSILGGILGAVAGLPIPLIGPVVGVLLFASAGALAGAVLGEDWAGRDLDHSVSVGMGAFWGRLLGSLAKAIVGAVMVALILVGMCL